MHPKATTPSNGLQEIGLAPFVNQSGGAPQGVASLSKIKHTLSTAEFAAEVGVSRKTVTGWVRKGRLRVIKNLRPYAVPRSELQRIMEGGFIHE